MRRIHAFTIPEILAVIAIIVIIISLLLPTLSKVREIGEKTVCMSNLHQISLAARTYGTESNGYIVSSRTWTVHSTGSNKWVNTPVTHSWKDAWHTEEALVLGELWPYLPNKDLWKCPSFMRVKTIGANPTYQCGHRDDEIEVKFTYSMNGAMAGDTGVSWGGYSWKKFVNVPRPNSFLFITEENPWRVDPSKGWQMNDGLFGFGPDHISTYHLSAKDPNSGSGTVAFMDMHTEQRWWYESVELSTP